MEAHENEVMVRASDAENRAVGEVDGPNMAISDGSVRRRVRFHAKSSRSGSRPTWLPITCRDLRLSSLFYFRGTSISSSADLVRDQSGLYSGSRRFCCSLAC
jgi:hypothetical protein